MSKPDESLPPRYEALRASIIRHVKWIRTYDPDYAYEAYQRYREELPWIALPPPRQ